MHRLAPMHPSFGLAWPDFGFELGDALKCGVGDSVFYGVSSALFC